MTTKSNFRNDLNTGAKAEQKVAAFLRTCTGVTSVTIPAAKKTGKERRDYERVNGDLLVHKDDKRLRFEVKSDGSMNKTGNLFLETLSDDGSRTGRETIGWFDNPDAQYEWFVFYNRANPYKSIIVKRIELKKWVDANRKSFALVAMKYNQTQANRSWGLLVPYAKLVSEVPSAKHLPIM